MRKYALNCVTNIQGYCLLGCFFFKKEMRFMAQSRHTDVFGPTNHYSEVKICFRLKPILRTAVKVLDKRCIRSKFQSSLNQLKLKTQSPLTLLLQKIVCQFWTINVEVWSLVSKPA